MAAHDPRIDEVVFDLLDDLEDDDEQNRLLNTRRPYQNSTDDTGNRRSKNRNDGRHSRQKGNSQSIRELKDDERNEHQDSQDETFQTLIGNEIVKRFICQR